MFYWLTPIGNCRGWGEDAHAAATSGQACGGGRQIIRVSWGTLIQRAGAGPEDAACRWGDERQACPVPLHQGIPPLGVGRVNARWGGCHHALPALPPAFDQRDDLCAAIGHRAHTAPRQGRARGPLDTAIAIVASTPGGLL